MICADFLAGAKIDNGDPEMLLYSMTRFFSFLSREQRQAFLGGLSEEKIVSPGGPNPTRLQLGPVSYERLRQQVLRRDGWQCQL
jgi:hypothetical protein